MTWFVIVLILRATAPVHCLIQLCLLQDAKGQNALSSEHEREHEPELCHVKKYIFMSILFCFVLQMCQNGGNISVVQCVSC